MACFEGKCFERPKNEVRRSGSLQRKGSRVKVVPAGDLVMGVHPNAERPSEMENMNALNEGALEKRGYNSAQRDCGCAKDYNLPEPFVDKLFPKPPPPPVFTPEPPPKYEPKAPPPEEFVPIPEPELKDNVPLPPPEEIFPIPTNTKKQNPGPPPPPPPPAKEGCTGYGWLSTQEQRERCCNELETVYGGVYEDQMKASEYCKDPSHTTETKQNEPIPPLSQVGQTETEVPANVIKVGSNNTKPNVRIVETPVGSGEVIDVVQTNGGPDSGFTVQTFQNGNITPVSDPNQGGVDEETDIQYEQELVDDGTDFSVDIPVGGNDSIDHFTAQWTQPSFPPISTVPSNTSVPSLAQQGPAPEEAQIIGQNTVSNKPIVAPSSGMNLGLDEVHGMPQCNSIVRSVTVSRCGDENPYSRGMAIFDSYAGREAAAPGFVVDTNGRRVLKVKSSSGLRTRVVPAGDIPGTPVRGFTDAQGRPITSLDQATDTSNKGGSGNETTSRGPSAGAVTASVFNSLTNVASDAFQYVNNQEANRVRMQIANLQQQRDLQLRAIESGDLRTRAEAEARLAQINQQAQTLQQGLERDRLQMQANQQNADRDMSFRTTALIAGSVLVLGMMGAGIYVATKK